MVAWENENEKLPERFIFSIKFRYLFHTLLSVCIACSFVFYFFFIKGENKNCVSKEDGLYCERPKGSLVQYPISAYLCCLIYKC